MCGIVASVSPSRRAPALEEALGTLVHRGPDADGMWRSPSGACALAHRRLSIIDLSAAGRQPMTTADGRYTVVFNGEIYNYLELRDELGGRVAFRTDTDTEVLLAAYARWGAECLTRLIGMFAFAIWDEREQTLFAARDRFGVKPLFFHEAPDGGLLLASEIKALHVAGVPRRPSVPTWATYLSSGMYDHLSATFWDGVCSLPPGAFLTWTPRGDTAIRMWYDAATAALGQGPDGRPGSVVGEELLSLLEHSVKLRFRSDVPVGICLSGGLDSSLLLALVHRTRGGDSAVKTFTFYCGDPAYDEVPWVSEMVAGTRHPARFCRLRAEDVPELARKVQAFQDEPFGGFPTLGMAMVHEGARAEGVVVLLDGNGLDEGWAGYDYYARAGTLETSSGPVQGTRTVSTHPDCLDPAFAAQARPFLAPRPFGDPLRDLQYRDIRYAKIPRAMRFADRVSMMFSRELREPFLDHRIVELGLRQPANLKIRDGQGKWLPRRVVAELLPERVRFAPKRPVQTPQREWLRGPLKAWAEEQIEAALATYGDGWLDREAVRKVWADFCRGTGDNSFFVWQWISLALWSQPSLRVESSSPAPAGLA